MWQQRRQDFKKGYQQHQKQSEGQGGRWSTNLGTGHLEAALTKVFNSGRNQTGGESGGKELKATVISDVFIKLKGEKKLDGRLRGR